MTRERNELSLSQNNTSYLSTANTNELPTNEDSGNDDNDSEEL